MAEGEVSDMPNGNENGFSNGVQNGLSNGSSEHRPHKDHKHKDKDRDRERHKSSHKDKDKDRSKDRHSSSHKSSHKDRHKDKHRSKDDKHRDSSKHRDKDRSKDKDKHRKDRKSSTSERRDSHHSSHKSSHREKHRDSEKHEQVAVKEEAPSFSSMDERFELQKPVINHEATMPKEEIESEDDSQLFIKEEFAEQPQPQEEDDDVPLAARKRVKVESDDDDVPLLARKKVKVERKPKREEDDFKPVKKVKKEPVKKRKAKEELTSPSKKKKKNEEDEHVWKWWEEEKKDNGSKWTFLEHKGPVFADDYEPLPKNIKFYYNNEHMVLSEEAEEVAGFYARMLDHDYTTKEVFNKNFLKDWRKTMTSNERATITDLSKCDFRKLHQYFLQLTEQRKTRTKDEKKALKEKNEQATKTYGWCNIDHHKQKIGNFKIEPPGLFRGRGEHPRQGMLKRRTRPEEVIINCSKDSDIPKPPPGHRWKEVRHDNQVTWLACWVENVQNQTKYVMLNAASKLKGEKDWQKYETARRLHKTVDRIRDNYRAEFKSKEMRVRQRAVALYFIDKLALRAGNEKDEDQADTVGCCSLRVEHLKLFEEKEGNEFVVVFDFLGKDSIRYYNEVPVEKRVFKNLQLFMENKQGADDLFDRLNTQIMNKYLNELMDGLTAKVFRTYNASRTLQEQLDKLTDENDNIPTRILSYNRANREVAILCNHQRAVPKTYEKSMANLQTKIDEKKALLADEKRHLKDLKKGGRGSVKESTLYDKKKKAVERVEEQLYKLEISATDKEENKQIALGTSKLNYLDPRISVAWCKKYDVPLEKIYNKTQRSKFQWAIDMATADYNFMGEPMNVTRNSQQSDQEGDEEDSE